MKTTIEELILQIVSTALLINQQGRHHVFFDLSPHVHSIHVRVCSADTDYQHLGYPSDTRNAITDRSNYDWLSQEEAPQTCHDEVTSTLTWLQGYLDMPGIPAQEAAA